MSNSYILHLGFNWNSPTIGWIWDPGASSSYRFLQYALARADGTAAWFQFTAEDTLRVKIWDLSPSSAPQLSSFAVNLSLSPLDDTGPAQSYTPSDYLTFDGANAVSLLDGTNPYLALVTHQFTYDGLPSPPWGTARGSSTVLGPVTFSAAAQLKLSFYLKIHCGSDSKVFISDPETIVGSGS